MKISVQILASLFFAGFSLVECRQRPDEVVSTNCRNREEVDEYLDKVMHRIREDLPDPMRIPPRSAFVELSDGLVWGLSNLTRFGSTEVTCEGLTITITARITTDEIKGRYTWTKTIRGRERQGFIVFISNDFEAVAEITMVHGVNNREDVHPQLNRFEILRLKKTKIEMTGMGYMTWALGEFTTMVSGIFQRSIALAIQGPLTEALQMRLREIKLE